VASCATPVQHPGAHGEGIQRLCSVRVTVARVHGHVEQVLPPDQVEPSICMVRAPWPSTFPGEPLHRRVGAVADPSFRKMPTNTGHPQPGDWRGRRDERCRPAGFEEVALWPSPWRWTRVSSTSRVPQRGGAGPRDCLVRVCSTPSASFLSARHVVEIPTHDRARRGPEPPAVEPHRFVAEPLDAPEVVETSTIVLPAALNLD
jgi:hypothetical protein